MSSKLVKVADNWDALTYEEKIALFTSSKDDESISAETPTVEQFKEAFGNDSFYIAVLNQDEYKSEDSDSDEDDDNTEDENEEDNLDYVALDAVKEPVFVPAKELIYIENKNNIDSVEIKSTYSNSAVVKILVTTDLSTYKTFYEGEWITVDTSNIKQILNIGLTPEEINALTTEEWAMLVKSYDSFSEIAFGYILDSDSAYDSCVIDTITLKVIDGYDGYFKRFKFICVGYDYDGKYKFIANQNVQTNISWESLNDEDLCTHAGRDMSYSKTSPSVILRLPNTSADNTKESSEWDSIINAEDNTIEWNTEIQSWTLDTPVVDDDNSVEAQDTMRITRGGETPSSFYNVTSTDSNSDIGYRPVMIIGSQEEEAAYIPPANLTTIKNIANSVVGNALTCEYFSSNENQAGRFSNLGNATKDLLADPPTSTPNGSFLFVHVGYTPSGAYKFAADRNIQGNISWETLNSAGYCTYSGVDAESLTGIKGSYIRLPQSYANNHSMDKTSSEWDAIFRNPYIGGSDIKSDWNIYKNRSWTLDTPSQNDDTGSEAADSSRIARGCEADDDSTMTRRIFDSEAVYGSVCFRPILIVPMDKQSAILSVTVTPTYINKHDVIIDSSVTPFKDNIDITTCSVRILINGNDTAFARETLTSNSHSARIPNDLFKDGENTLKVIYTVDDIDNEYEVKIVKEVVGDTSKIRDFKKYTGGFVLNTNSINDNLDIVSNLPKTKTNSKAGKMIIPKNTIKITLTED
jgi:hypothetical protein